MEQEQEDIREELVDVSEVELVGVEYYYLPMIKIQDLKDSNVVYWVVATNLDGGGYVDFRDVGRARDILSGWRDECLDKKIIKVAMSV